MEMLSTRSLEVNPLTLVSKLAVKVLLSNPPDLVNPAFRSKEVKPNFKPGSTLMVNEKYSSSVIAVAREPLPPPVVSLALAKRFWPLDDRPAHS